MTGPLAAVRQLNVQRVSEGLSESFTGEHAAALGLIDQAAALDVPAPFSRRVLADRGSIVMANLVETAHAGSKGESKVIYRCGPLYHLLKELKRRAQHEDGPTPSPAPGARLDSLLERP